MSTRFSRSSRHPARLVATLAFAGAAALTLAACGGSNGSGSASGSGSGSNSGGAAASGAVVTTHSTSALGKVYADAAGNTIYAADQEAGGKVMCTAQCLQFWHPVLDSGSGSALPSGADFGTVKRPDSGKQQVTLDGKPLYTFAEDKQPGATTGDGAKDAFAGLNFTWHALRTDSAAAPAPSSSAPGMSGSGGYAGY